MGAIEDALRRREDVDDAEIGAIIELAARLQEQSRGRLSTHELVDIAEQLDIEAEFVEQAIASRREAAEREAEQAAELAQARQRQLRAAKLAGAGAGALLLLVGAIMLGVGASRLASAAAELDEHRGKLERVIDRSFAAAPQQLALLGVDSAAIEPARAAYRDAEELEAKLVAARQLDDALAEALASAPESDDEHTAQVRLNLHYELTGFDNRLATELERYRAAQRRRAELEARPGPWLARKLGVAR
ncbi:MAG: hypothetical protein R6X02_19680 [Enhygromyxa sp.]